MRLLFVHGIAQQDYSEDQLLSIWTDHLLDHGVNRAKVQAAKPEMAYYGDRLFAWVSGDASAAVPMGPPISGEEMAFLSKALDEIAASSGLDEDEIEFAANQAAIEEGAGAIGQSTWLGRRAVAIVSLLEKISPLRGSIAARVVRQAYVYLANRHARTEIDGIVRPRIGTGEVVIVSHSLGTVVAFNLLRELAGAGVNVKVPLFATLGSPLAITEVKRHVGGSFAIPSIVGRWLNFYDKGDPVTLGRPLGPNFSAGIVDTIVDNNTQNGHSIAGYLDDMQLVGAINAVL